MIRLKLTKQQWVSQLVSQLVSDKHNQWSDSGPIKKYVKALMGPILEDIWTFADKGLVEKKECVMVT